MAQAIRIGLSGLAGWKVLQKSKDKYKHILSLDPTVAKNISHFHDKIHFANSADKIVKDFRMLSVALGSSGLQEDIANRGFIKKVLQSDIENDKSFANRLGDKRYKQLAESFQFLGKEIEKAKPQSDYLTQIGLLRTDKDIRKLALKIEKTVADIKAIYESKKRVFSTSSLNSEQVKFYEKSLIRRSLRQLIEDQNFRKIIKSSLSLGEDWDTQPKTEQLRIFLQAARSELNVNSDVEIFEQENIDRLVWGYAYNNLKLIKDSDNKENSFNILKLKDTDDISKLNTVQKNAIDIRDRLRSLNYRELDNSQLLAAVMKDRVLSDSMKIVLGLNDDFYNNTDAERESHIFSEIKNKLNINNFNDLTTEDNVAKYIGKYISNSQADKVYIAQISLGDYEQISIKKILEIRNKIINISSRSTDDFTKFESVFRNTILAGFVKTVFDLPDEFFSKSKYNQAKDFSHILKSKYGTDSFDAFSSPENLQKNLGIALFKQRYKENQEVKDPIKEISANYLEHEFERRVGLGDESLRLALNAKRELGKFVSQDASDRELWFRVLGNPPLRKVFETAFGFNPALAQLDIDRQHQLFIKASDRILGTSSFKEIGKPEYAKNLIRKFLIRSQIPEVTVTNRFSTALILFSA